MARFVVPTNASIHATHSFIEQNNFFDTSDRIAMLSLNPKWMHLEPMALSMIAAWGTWCKRQGLQISVENWTKSADYAARMKLFDHLGIDYPSQVTEHEEAGRFLPLRNVQTRDDVRGVIADVSALLHLDRDVEALAAVQYCMSELLRNVLEHSNSPDGAFVCAHNYTGTGTHRVTIGIADCGIGISKHLGRAYPEIENDDLLALRYAMQPGITGAISGMYGTPDNAGAGLFITRCIAKGTGGYFQIISGNAAYRLRQAITEEDRTTLHADPFDDRCDKWRFPYPWLGTVVTMEIRTEQITEFESYFGWIREKIPSRVSVKGKIRFT